MPSPRTLPSDGTGERRAVGTRSNWIAREHKRWLVLSNGPVTRRDTLGEPMKTITLALFFCLSVAPAVTVVYTLTETVIQSVKLEAARALTAAVDREDYQADVREGDQR